MLLVELRHDRFLIKSASAPQSRLILFYLILRSIPPLLALLYWDQHFSNHSVWVAAPLWYSMSHTHPFLLSSAGMGAYHFPLLLLSLDGHSCMSLCALHHPILELLTYNIYSWNPINTSLIVCVPVDFIWYSIFSIPFVASRLVWAHLHWDRHFSTSNGATQSRFELLYLIPRSSNTFCVLLFSTWNILSDTSHFLQVALHFHLNITHFHSKPNFELQLANIWIHNC